MNLGDKSTSDELIPNDSASNEDASTTEVTMDLRGMTENLQPRKKFHVQMIIMGREVSDLEINLAQQLLKEQFIKLHSLQSMLLQEKVLAPMKEELQNKVHKEQKHWVVAITINCDKNEVAVYHSFFAFLDKESMQIVETLCDNIKLTVNCQRQKV